MMPQSVVLSSQKEKHSKSPITKACDMCRQKKIRCDLVSEVCAQCIKYKTHCHFTPISMKRAPRRSGTDKRVEELEKRLKMMEGLLKRPVSDQQSGLNGAEFENGPGRSEAPSFYNQQGSRGFDSNSNLNLASMTAGEEFQAADFGIPWLEVSSNVVNSSQIEVFSQADDFDNNISKYPVIKALPPKDRLLSLVEKSVQSFYPAYPLFDKARFMSIFDSLDQSINDPGRWACLNIVLALASQFQRGTAQDKKEDSEAFGYFRTAFAVVGQLMTMRVTLWSVQALLGMALIIQGTPNHGPVSSLVSAAMRLAHRMGLHRRCQNPNISAAEIKERNRVFWIAYSLDKNLSLQMRQPSVQDDDDMDVELPCEIDRSSIYPGESAVMDFFDFRVKLAMIQGQIYKRLYSVKATKQAIAERAVAAKELEVMLQSWRASVPVKFIQHYCGPVLQMPASGTIRQPILLQLLYFNSLASVYDSLPTLSRYRELSATGDAIKSQLLSGPRICATEARKAIELLPNIPRRRYSCIWAVLSIFVTAAKTLLRSIICDPTNPTALSDLKLIEPLLTLLGVLAKSTNGRNSERVSEMHRSCKDLFERANMAFESTNFANMDWDQSIMSVPSQEHESIEEFLQRMEKISSGDDAELDSIPPGMSRDFAFAIEHQFHEWTSI